MTETAIARGLLVAVLAGFAGVHVLLALPEPVPALLVGAVLGLQLVQVLPGLSRVPLPGLLAVQAAAGYLAVLGYGSSVGVLGFLTGSLLIAGAWPLSVLVVAGAAVIEAVRSTHPGTTADATISTLLTGLVIHGLARLVDRVDEVGSARLALAGTAVTEERLRIATELSEGIGRGIAAIKRIDPDRPELIGGVLEVARRALADTRSAATGYRASPLPATGEEPSPRLPGEYALSVTLLTAVLVGFSVKALLHVPWDLVLPAAGCLAVIVLMQLHAVRGRHPWALGAMALLAYLPLVPFGPAWLGAPGFLAGPVLLAFPAWASWPLMGVIMTSVAAIGAASGLSAAATVNFTVSALVTGLVIYGLVRLAQLVRELREARERLARAAVVRERLRAARDLHDLLGHSMAAILLTCELARRLAGTDPTRARAELVRVAEMAERAEADLRSVASDRRELSLSEEAESARSVLAAAGIAVDLTLAHGPLPPRVSTLLSTVLREAVTNVLRHSAATHCAIETRSEEALVRLGVTNDGAHPARGAPGSGHVNLVARLADLGGRLTAGAEAGGRYRLLAECPVSDPAGLGGDPDGVGPVAGVELGHDGRDVVPHRAGR
ncbi:histidine kinase [Streptosporangium sp. KLBMP 9127]|nr:histidine kinase [Streptosporangium sp. KLBMP 9127]